MRFILKLNVPFQLPAVKSGVLMVPSISVPISVSSASKEPV